MAAHFCPHCLARTNFGNAGPNIGWNGRTHSLWVCQNCQGVVYVSSLENDFQYYPSVKTEAPDELPQTVREDYNEAIRSMNANNPKSAVIMCRAALQAAMREQGANGENLKQEIDDLADRHVVPAALRDWAHDIRDGGNLVAHPAPGKVIDMRDAQELMALTESVFQYLYVVPSQVKARRETIGGSGA
ncbi:MAG: DUF4145 domain-containing protein [Dehalococcoidia bacterium]